MTTTLSNRTWSMLRALMEVNYMSVATARKYDQRAFAAMLRRDFVRYRRGKGFFITAKGVDAHHDFRETDIKRQNPYGALTRYFDPHVYGLEIVPRKSAAA